MKPQVQKQLIEALKKQICELLDTHETDICDAYEEALQEHDNDKKFSFNVPIKGTLTGIDPDNYEVSAMIAFAVKHKDSRSIQVKTGKDMVDAMNEKKKR